MQVDDVVAERGAGLGLPTIGAGSAATRSRIQSSRRRSAKVKNRPRHRVDVDASRHGDVGDHERAERDGERGNVARELGGDPFGAQLFGFGRDRGGVGPDHEVGQPRRPPPHTGPEPVDRRSELERRRAPDQPPGAALDEPPGGEEHLGPAPPPAPRRSRSSIADHVSATSKTSRAAMWARASTGRDRAGLVGTGATGS